ncbi:MAG: GAP family protein [Solirubrobacterales bacterium]
MLPFALAGAISPMVLTEQTVLLTTAGGRRTASIYAAGAVLVLTVYISLLLLFGNLISFPAHESFSASVDLGLGIALLLFASFLRHRGKVKAARRVEKKEKQDARMAVGPAQAFGFGVLGMATNVTTLAALIPAAKIISERENGLIDNAVLGLIVVVIAAIPAWIPIVLTLIAPGPADRFLKALGDFFHRRGRLVLVLIFGLLGAYLIVTGLLKLAS